MRYQAQQRFRMGITVTELLVVLALVGVLVALILPTISMFRNSADTTECISNQRQIVSGILLYAAEHDGKLPPYGYTVGDGTMRRNPDGSIMLWSTLIRPYMGLASNQFIGSNYMRCPAEPGRATGVLFSEVAGLAPFGSEGPSNRNPAVMNPGSMRLNQLGRGTMLTADCYNPVFGHLWILSPNQFPLTVDTDGDGIPDSLPGNPSSNWFSTFHNGSAVCSFADGSVKAVPLSSWAQNENNMWGP